MNKQVVSLGIVPPSRLQKGQIFFLLLIQTWHTISQSVKIEQKWGQIALRCMSRAWYIYHITSGINWMCASAFLSIGERRKTSPGVWVTEKSQGGMLRHWLRRGLGIWAEKALLVEPCCLQGNGALYALYRWTELLGGDAQLHCQFCL